MTTIKTYVSDNGTIVEVKNDGHSHNSVRFNRTGKFQRIKKADLEKLLADCAESVEAIVDAEETEKENLPSEQPVENSADEQIPVFDEIPEECQNMRVFVAGILEQKFELALVVGKFRYYVDKEESDENACVALYRDGELLSDNYFAYNSLFEELCDVHTGKSEPDFISDFLKEIMVSMAENGDFDDEEPEVEQENMVQIGNHNLILNDNGVPTGIQVVTKGIVRKVSPLYLRDADYSTKTYVSGSVKVIHHLQTGKFEICANAVA